MNIQDVTHPVTEAERGTTASTEIRTSLRRAGYRLLGQGTDATVWAKPTGAVIKIIMPDDGQGAGVSGDTFMKFYEFCKQNPDLENLPRFSANEVEVFEADGKSYVMVTMERLKPIPKGSFQEAVTWLMSDIASSGGHWSNIAAAVGDPKTWNGYGGGLSADQIVATWQALTHKEQLEYRVLFELMRLLWHRGRINRVGWDLHTENAMMRGNTIVITDPWFTNAMVKQ